MPHVPLRRNRDFVLLQTGQLLSTAGTQSTTIAYPLLVLAATQSPARAGLVAFARTVPCALFGVLAGVAADRWSRKRLMIAADGARVLALGSLAAATLLDRLAYLQVLLVAFVEGAASTLFSAAQVGAIRGVVPIRQLPAASATETGRTAAVRLAGPPLGGALFGLGRAVPLVADAVSYAASTVSLLAMRTPFQEERERDPARLRARIAEGLRFLWSQPFLRTCALLFGIANFVFPGLLLVLVVAGPRQGLSGAEIGGLTAACGAALLLGSFLSPVLRRALAVRTILVLELWLWTASVAFVVWPSVYVLAAAVLPQALVIPASDSVVVGLRIALTPDRLLGRVHGAAQNVSLSVSSLGPLAAGFLLGETSPRSTVAVFAAGCVVLALWGTLSPSMRQAPSLDELSSATFRP